MLSAVKLLEGRYGAAGAAGRAAVDVDPVIGLKRRFLHVVVDEYQDTSPVQARLVELLSGRAHAVGDDDRAIYGWRGADVSRILGFPDHQPGCELIRLEQNYRSTGHILRCADAIIRRNEAGSARRAVERARRRRAGDVARACEDEREEARFVVNEILDALNEDILPEEIAVFYRPHAQSRVIEQRAHRQRHALRDLRQPPGSSSAREIKDTLAYLRLLQNPNSDLDFTRIVNEPARGIGDTTVGRLTALAANHSVSLLTVARSPEEAGVSGAATKRLAGFVAMIDELAAACAPGCRSASSPPRCSKRTGYRDALVHEVQRGVEARVENLDEFVGALTHSRARAPRPGDKLADYLEQVSTVSDADGGGHPGKPGPCG